MAAFGNSFCTTVGIPRGLLVFVLSLASVHALAFAGEGYTRVFVVHATIKLLLSLHTLQMGFAFSFTASPWPEADIAMIIGPLISTAYTEGQQISPSNFSLCSSSQGSFDNGAAHY